MSPCSTFRSKCRKGLAHLFQSLCSKASSAKLRDVTESVLPILLRYRTKYWIVGFFYVYHSKNESSNWPSSSRIQSKFKSTTQSNQFTIFLFFTSVEGKFMQFYKVTLLSPPAVLLSSTPNFTKHSNFKNHTSPLHNAFRVQDVYLILLPPNKLWPSFSSKDITHWPPQG